MRPRMPVFWGNNNRHNRHDRHDHQTHVTTTGGPMIVDAHDSGHHHDDYGHHRHGHDHGHHHDGGHHSTVLAVPATNIGTHVTGVDRDRGRRYRGGREPSTIHGWLTKILGSLTGNRRRRRRGEREMRRARDHRHALRTARQVERARDTGNNNKLRKFYRRRHRKRSHHRDEPVVISQDGGRSRGRTPWGHYGSRTLPTYHGAHHRFLGLFFGGRERRARGKAMAIAAEEERRRERRRRREEMKDHGRRFRERRRY